MSNVIFRHTMILNTIDNKAKEFLLRLSKAKRGDLAANVTFYYNHFYSAYYLAIFKQIDNNLIIIGSKLALGRSLTSEKKLLQNTVWDKPTLF
jgi:hypothetical protein